VGSQIIETACGPIEYATFGQGLPVLVFHGVVGGFDQGLDDARWRLEESVQPTSAERGMRLVPMIWVTGKVNRHERRRSIVTRQGSEQQTFTLFGESNCSLFAISSLHCINMLPRLSSLHVLVPHESSIIGGSSNESRRVHSRVVGHADRNRSQSRCLANDYHRVRSCERVDTG